MIIMGSNHGNLTKVCGITVGVLENNVEQLKPLLINSQGRNIMPLEFIQQICMVSSERTSIQPHMKYSHIPESWQSLLNLNYILQ